MAGSKEQTKCSKRKEVHVSKLPVWTPPTFCTFIPKEAVISNSCCCLYTLLYTTKPEYIILLQKSCVSLTGEVYPLPSTGRITVFVLAFILLISKTLSRVKGFQNGQSDPTKCLMCFSRKQKFPFVSLDENLDALFPSSLDSRTLLFKRNFSFLCYF